MSATVLVFSADQLRSNILKTILSRSGFEPLFFTRILEAGRAIARHTPEVVIFDTVGCFAEEINNLRNLCRLQADTVAIVLGAAAVVEGFKGPLIRSDLCLSEPLDPELIVTKLKELMMFQEEEKCADNDTLEKNLKHLLNLE